MPKAGRPQKPIHQEVQSEQDMEYMNSSYDNIPALELDEKGDNALQFNVVKNTASHVYSEELQMQPLNKPQVPVYKSIQNRNNIFNKRNQSDVNLNEQIHRDFEGDKDIEEPDPPRQSPE